jgi:hypothetical protein
MISPIQISILDFIRSSRSRKFRSRSLSFLGLTGGAIATLTLGSCTHPPSQATPGATNQVNQLEAMTIDAAALVSGQTLYVPVYAYVYHLNSQNNAIPLSATLSIHNTDRTFPIVITTVDYYDMNGHRLRGYVENPVRLDPLASTEVFIEARDVTGGSGANFIVEWGAEQQVSEPVVEAVLISTASTQGISLISPGRVIFEVEAEDSNSIP